jgi:hypothetical protein
LRQNSGEELPLPSGPIPALKTHGRGVIAPFPTEPRGDTSHLTNINQYLMLHSYLDESTEVVFKLPIFVHLLDKNLIPEQWKSTGKLTIA